MTAQLWDFGSKSPIGRTLKCEMPVTSIRFTTEQDGMVTGLAAATDDFNVQLWTLNGEQMSAGAVLKDIRITSPPSKSAATAAGERPQVMTAR